MSPPAAVSVSATEPDWSRERPRGWWDPPRKLLRAIRRYQAAGQGGGVAKLRRKYWALQHRFWSAITQAEIDLHARIGGGLLIPHPNGIVIHPQAEIGPNCLIFQQVTLGTSGRGSGVPRLGGHVDVGAGAKILGGIVLGDHVRVGANAVVLSDVPEGGVATGVPARVRTSS